MSFTSIPIQQFIASLRELDATPQQQMAALRGAQIAIGEELGRLERLADSDCVPPAMISIDFCPACGRNDRFLPFTGKSHFASGEKCLGVPMRVQYLHYSDRAQAVAPDSGLSVSPGKDTPADG